MQSLSNEELLAQLSDEDDMNQDSNFQYAIVGDEDCSQLKDAILSFLHEKDLLPSVDISNVYMKNPKTVLLSVNEDITEDLLEQINKALIDHRQFNLYKVVNWVQYQMSQQNVDSDEEGEMGAFEVADNMRGPRSAIHQKQKKLSL